MPTTGEHIHLRTASSTDLELLFQWRNDPWIISLSESKRPVTMDQHRLWFEKTLTSSHRLLFIVTIAESENAGTVRFDHNRGECEITVYLMKEFTGRGLGVDAVKAAIPKAFDKWPEASHISANIRPENSPSLRAFKKCGFIEQPSETNMVKMTLPNPNLTSLS